MELAGPTVAVPECDQDDDPEGAAVAVEGGIESQRARYWMEIRAVSRASRHLKNAMVVEEEEKSSASHGKEGESVLR